MRNRCYGAGMIGRKHRTKQVGREAAAQGLVSLLGGTDGDGGDEGEGVGAPHDGRATTVQST